MVDFVYGQGCNGGMSIHEKNVVKNILTILCFAKMTKN